MMDLITEYIATWTGAEIPQANGGRGRGRGANGQSPHGIKKLRELILELAVRGKLVPQDPNDEPASVLLDKIAKEKARLIKDGKIKKDKPLPKISEDEEPFELPQGWSLARLGEIGHDWGQKTPERDFTYIDVSSIDNKVGYVNAPNVLGASEAPSRARKIVKVGTVIYSTVRPYLKNICVIDQEYSPEPITSTAFAILHPLQQMPGRYIFAYLRSPVFVRYVESVQTGIAYPAINDRQFFGGLIPIPPLAEQHRIVAKVDELMALCDKLEQQQANSNETHQTLVKTLLAPLATVADPAEFAVSWQRIVGHFDTLFTTEESIDQLKQTILQLAVMGKLVPQDPNDEPASTLLEKIAKEKAKLIKEGKIKKQKTLPKISEDEKPFELPKGWEWARFPELGEFGRGKSKHRPRNDPSLYAGGKYPMVQTGDVARAARVIKTYTAMYNYKGFAQSRLWPKGTMCITIAANIADSGILGFEACFPDSVVGLIPSKEIEDSRYFEYFMRTAKENLIAFAPSTAQKNINLGILETVYIPLPPAEEIKRIVAKVDELMTLCDTLKKRLHDAKTSQVQLADAIVEQAVA